MKKLKDAFSSLYTGDNVVKLTELRYIPRWTVLFLDLSIAFLSIFISYYFIEKLHVRVNFPEYIYIKIAIIITVNALFMFVYKTYAGIIRHSTFFDFFKIILCSGSTLSVLLVINFIFSLDVGKPLFLYPNLFLYFFISISIMFFFSEWL